MRFPPRKPLAYGRKIDQKQTFFCDFQLGHHYYELENINAAMFNKKTYCYAYFVTIIDWTISNRICTKTVIAMDTSYES